MDATLSNARLADGRTVDISFQGGVISSVEPSSGAAMSDADDICGWLVLPSMAEPHAHLDKALTAEDVPNPSGDLEGAIKSWMANANRFTPEDTDRRARAALDLLILHGATAVRSHVNCGEHLGDESMRVLAAIRQDYAGLVDLQLVALTSTPMTGPDGSGNRAALAAAIEAGADIVGGCPHLDPDPVGLIDVTLDAANDAGLPVDLHVDETLDANMLSLRHLARRVQERGFDKPVAASHCVSLGMQPPAIQQAVSREVADAGVSVITLPQTNLFLQGHENPTAMPRGLTAVHALRNEHATVAAGADNVQDPFNLVGRSDPLETAALMVMAAHVLPDDAYEMVSSDVRSVMGLDPVSISVGDPADLVAIDAVSTRSAIADAPMARRVYRRGTLVASSTTTTTIHR